MATVVELQLLTEINQSLKAIKGFERQTIRTLKSTQKAAEKAGNSFNRIRDGLTALLSRDLIVRSLRTASNAVTGLTTDFAELGDRVAKTSDKLGVGIEALQELRFAATQSGISVQTFDTALQRFTRRSAEAATGTGVALKTFQKLGIQLKDTTGRLRPAENILGDVAEAFTKVQGEGEKVRLAFSLFDTEGVDLVRVLNLGRNGLDELRDQFRKTGAVISKESARAAEEFTNELGVLSSAIDGVRNTLASKLLPILTESVKGISNFIIENRELIVNILSKLPRLFRLAAIAASLFLAQLAVGRVVAFTQALTTLTKFGILRFIVAIKRAGIAIKAFKAAATLGIALVIDFLIDKFFEFSEEFGGFGNSLDAVGFKIQATFQDVKAVVLLVLSDIIDRFQTFEIGGVRPFKGVGDSISKDFVEKAKVAVKESARLRDEVKKLQKQGSEGISIRAGITGGGLLPSDPQIKETIKKLLEGLKTLGKSRLQIALEERNERLDAIDDIISKNTKLSKDQIELLADLEANERKSAFREIIGFQNKLTDQQLDDLFDARIRSEKQFQKDKAEIEKQEREKQAKAQSQSLGEIVGPGFSKGFRESFGVDLQAAAGGKAAFAGVVDGVVKGITTGGREGAVQVVKSVANLIPVIGPIFSQFVDFLSTGVDNVRQTIVSTLENIPDVIFTIVEVLQELPFILTEAVIRFIETFFERLPEFIERWVSGFISNIPRIIQAVVRGVPRIISSIISSLPKIVSSFISGLIEAVSSGKFILELAKAIGEAVSQAFSSLTGGLDKIGGIGGGLGKILGGPLTNIGGGIGKLVGGLFQQGGLVRGPFSTKDNILAGLQSGEFVVDRSDTKKLLQLLNSDQRTGGFDAIVEKLDALVSGGNRVSSQPVSVELKIGQRELGNVLLDLKRQGIRGAV